MTKEYITIAKQALLLAACLLAIGYGWYKYYVEPRDAAIWATSECLGVNGLDMNEANWERCWNESVSKLRGSE